MPISALLTVLALATPLVAQAYPLHGSLAGFGGESIARMGDINADGIDDFVVGFPGDTSVPISPTIYSGTASFVSGIDMSVIDTFSSPGGQFHYGQIVEGIDDINGDGVADAIIGAPNGGFRVDVRSGFDGTVIWSHTGNPGLRSVSALGDYDGGGTTDVVVGLGLGPGTRVEIVSGESGTVILTIPNLDVDTVLALDDISGDGVPDLAVGMSVSPWDVRFLSGADGSFLHGANGAASPTSSYLLRRAGDIDGDGLTDIVAPEMNLTGNDLVVCSSADGSIIHTLDVPGSGLAAFDGGSDTTGDGVPDVIALQSGNGIRVAHVFSGATGMLVNSTAVTGGMLRFVGNLDQDGLADFAAGGTSSVSAYVTDLPTGPKLGPCAVSRVGIGVGAPDQVLTINGSDGGLTHRVDVAAGSPFTVEMAQPQGNPFPAGFVISGWVGVPGPLEETVLPFGIGTLCIPSALVSPGYPGAFTLTSSFGNIPDQLVSSTPAPWQLQGAPIPFPIQVTFQGLIVATPITAVLTNGVILNYQ